MKEINLSVIIIAKNAEETIQDAIRSVTFADEILVVDAGSTDKTVQISKSLGAEVIKGESSSFAQQRNIGLKHAKGKWILYVDTDEQVSPSLKESIMHHVVNSTHDAYKVLRQNYYLGNNVWPKVEQLERFFKKGHIKEWYGQLHETAKVEGSVGILEGYLLHYTHRDLESMLNKTIVWSKIEASLRFETHHPKIVWWRLIRVMMTGFFNSYIRAGGWKSGTMGFIESMYQSYSMFITYATLWEMQRKSRT